MIGILRDQNMSEQARACESAFYRPRWSWRLHDAVAGLATQLRTHVADDLEAGPHILQHLGCIRAQFAHLASTVGAVLLARQVRVNLAWKMFRQRAAKGLRCNRQLRLERHALLFNGIGGTKLFKL